MKHVENIAQKKERLLIEAPNCKDIAMLSKNLNIGRTTIYRYCDDDEVFKKALEKIIGKNYIDKKGDKPVKKAKEKAKTHKGKTGNGTKGEARQVKSKQATYKTFTVRVPDRHSHSVARNSIQHSDDDKLLMIENVCEMFESGVNIEDACESMKLNKSTFYRWLQPESSTYCERGHQRYNEAKLIWEKMLGDSQIVMAVDTMNKLLVTREFTEVTKIGKMNSKGEIKAHTVKQTVKQIEPSVTLVKMVVESQLTIYKKKDPDADKPLDGDDVYGLKFLSDEELQANLSKY